MEVSDMYCSMSISRLPCRVLACRWRVEDSPGDHGVLHRYRVHVIHLSIHTIVRTLYHDTMINCGYCLNY